MAVAVLGSHPSPSLDNISSKMSVDPSLMVVGTVITASKAMVSVSTKKYDNLCVNAFVPRSVHHILHWF